MATTSLKARHTHERVLRALGTARVVVVNGPRQAGKTTLVTRQLHPLLGGTYVTLDDPDELAACVEDPVLFINRPRPVLIDEFQRAGDPLLRAIKLVVDRDLSPGQFVLTGSTRFLTVPTISESLAGRVHIVDLWPFTQGEADELGPSADRFLANVLEPGFDFLTPLQDRPLPGRGEYLDRVWRGGYPPVYERPGADAVQSFFRNYLRTVVQRDVPEISRVRHTAELPTLTRLLAAGSGQELNIAELARRSGIDRSSLTRNYLPLLETLYLNFRIPAWSRSIVRQVRRQPKSYLADSGLAAHLLRVEPSRLESPTSPVTGPLVETFVVNELVRQLSRLEDEVPATLFHYRSAGGVEIDSVIETYDGRVAAIEVKASTSVRSRDLDRLRRFKAGIERLSDLTFVRGVVLNTGDKALSFGDGIAMLPLAALWEPLEA